MARGQPKEALDDVVPAPDSRLTYVLWQSQRCCERLMMEALQPLGMTLSQFGVLVHLTHAPGLSGAELARRLNVTPQSVSVAVAEAKASGWLRADAHAVHRSVVELGITKAGSKVLRGAMTAVRAVEERISCELQPGDRERLLTLLLRLRAGARRSASSLDQPAR